MVSHCGEMCLGAILGHVRVVTDGINAFLLGSLNDRGGIGMVSEHVGTLGDEHVRGLALAPRVVPGVGPDDLGSGLGVDALHAEDAGFV